MDLPLPLIPAKRYFTIGEVAQLCGVKPHVLRYWEQEFTQLRPMKRRGNRRYYQHHEVLMIRRIRDLLYDEGFTISGARNKLREGPPLWQVPEDRHVDEMEECTSFAALHPGPDRYQVPAQQADGNFLHTGSDMHALHKELREIRALLAIDG